jgi:hypothetical protein
MEKFFLKVGSIVIIFFGFYICINPKYFSEKIEKFYRNYPIIRYANEKQFKSRTWLIRLSGVIVILVGLICILTG